MNKDLICRIDKCKSVVLAKGLCRKHYQRIKKSGTSELKTSGQRFESKIERIPECGCWIWMGAHHKDTGHGNLRANKKYTGAHRFAWEHFNGPIKGGFFVCHRCDTPSCVNPHHLFLGTQKDNMEDMARKGRRKQAIPRQGEAHHFAKLTDQDIKNIRISTLKNSELAKTYSVSKGHIWRIRSNTQWKHLHEVSNQENLDI